MNLDDMPVGQHTTMSIPEFLPEERPSNDQTDPTSSLPLSERLTNRNAKLRFEAFAELFKLFSEAPNADPIFASHMSSFPKYLSDSHPGSQEKAMDCFILLLSKSCEKPTDISGLASSLIEKGYTSAKTGVKTKATSCLLALSQLENASTAINDVVINLIGSKNPKVSMATIRALTELLANFGNGVYPIKSALGHVLTQATSTNSGIKTEAMNYFKEAYRWIKEGLFPALSSLKETQQEELKTFCSGISGAAAEPRFFVDGKSVAVSPESFEPKPQPKPRKRETEAAIDLGRFNEGWCEKLLQVKKWSEKRDMLEEVLKVLNDENAKLENYSYIAQCLKKLLDNSNIVVVNLALRCLGLLAAGLKGTFCSFAKNVLHTIVQKCKDKKTLSEAQRCLEFFVNSFNISDILDDIKEILNDKSPLVKLHVCNWIEKAVIPRMTMEDVARLIPTLGKLTDDASNEVRDAVLSCFGAMKVTKDCDALDKMIQEMIPQKQEKITQVISRITNKQAGVEPMDLGLPEDNFKYKLLESTKPKERKYPPNKPPQNVTKSYKEEEPEISEEEIIQLLAEKFPLDSLEGLSKSNWKERLSALQTINQLIEAKPDLEPQYIESVAQIIAIKLKNFKESNAVVLKEGIKILTNMATNYVVSSKFANTVVSAGLIEKLSDVKVAEAVSELLLAIGDSINPKQIISNVIKVIGNMKNPNAIKGSLMILEQFLREFTVLLVPMKPIIECTKQYLTHSNVNVKNAAISLVCRIYTEVGDIIKPLLISDLKDSILKTLESELSKTQVESKSEHDINRHIKGETEKEWTSKKASKFAIVDTLLPRVNIAPQITSKILSGLTNSGMKQRQEAKESLEKILFAANFRIHSNGLNTLFNALKTRMNEPCKNLAKGFISLIGTLAASMGSGVRQYARIILQPLLYNLADKQASIRSETLVALDKFAETAGADCVINAAGLLLEKDNPELRSGILGWILKNKQGLEKADLDNLIRGLINCMQDRSKDIRSIAEEIIGEMVPLVGHETFMNAIKDLKPTVRETLKLILDKYRVMVPLYSQAKEEPMETSPTKTVKLLKQVDDVDIVSNTTGNSTERRIEEQKTIREYNEQTLINKSTEWSLKTKLLQHNDLVREKVEHVKLETVKGSTISTLLASPLSSFEIMKILNDKIRTEPNLLLFEKTQIFRWLSLKISINILSEPACDFLYSFFSLFSSNHVTLDDDDANAILPAICDKFSGCNALFSLLCSGIYPASKVVYFLSKPLEYASPRNKLECLINIKQIIISQGESALSQIELRTFVQLLSSTEEEVKNGVIKVLNEVFKLIGEEIWTHLTDIAENHRLLLKQTFSNTGSETNSIIRSLKKCSITEFPETITKKPSSQKRTTSSRIARIESLEECLEQLKYGEISTKIDALIYVGEKATFAMDGISDVILIHCNEVIAAFTEVMKGLFDMGFDEVHLRFIKYFMNVINKICSSKVIVEHLRELELYNIIEQLLIKLLFDGLERLGSNSEGEALMKCINSTILRLLENCQPTRVYCVLISLLKTYVYSSTIPNPLLSNSMCNKFPGLIVKCLLKLTKVIDQLIPNIDLARLFLAIHEFLILVPPSPHAPSSNEEIASRIIKTIVNEVVKIKREQVWEAYNEVKKHKVPDVRIEKWIKVILKSLKTASVSKVKEEKGIPDSNNEVLTECKNRLAAVQSNGDIYARINQFKMRMMSNMNKKFN